MLSRYSHQNLTWIDLECPTREEAAAVGEEYGLHPLVVSELSVRSERCKVDTYQNALYAVLRFPVRNRSTGHIEEAEIDFVLLGDTLITTHYELVDPLHDFARMFEAGTHRGISSSGDHAGMLFFLQMRELYKHTFFILESTEAMIREIEKEVFKGKEDAMVERLSKASSAVLDIRAALRSHKEMLRSVSQSGGRMYGPEFGSYMAVVEGEYAHIEQALEESRQMVSDLRRTNDSLLSSKTNAIIKTLTVISIVFAPLNLTAFIFAMHSPYIELETPEKLAAVFGAMGLMCLGSILYFRSKKWL